MPSDITTALKRLGIALLNATLLLAALVLFLAVMLVWQLRGFADDMRGGLRAELVALQPQVEAARTSAREALAALDSADGRPRMREDLAALVARLDALDPASAPRVETESLLQRLVLAILSAAAAGLLAPADPA